MASPVKTSSSPSRRSSATSQSPKRRPLHERSASQANERLGPTIRIVNDADAQIYSKSPFPTHPSHVLAPVKKPGYGLDDQGRVSDCTPTIESEARLRSLPPTESLFPKPLQLPKANRASASTATSDAETVTNNGSSFSPSLSSRFSQGTTPPSSPTSYRDDHIAGPHERPGFEKGATIRRVFPSYSQSEPRSSIAEPLQPPQQLTSSKSHISLASSESTDTLAPQSTKHRRSTVSSAKSGSSNGKSQRTASSNSRSSKRASSAIITTPKPILKKSQESLATKSSSSFEVLPGARYLSKVPKYTTSQTSLSSALDRPRSATAPPSATPTHDALQVTFESGVKVQYPIVRPPSASSSWAGSSVARPQIPHPSRMNDRPPYRPHQWSSHLSTIPSESERASQVFSESSRASGSFGGSFYGQVYQTQWRPTVEDVTSYMPPAIQPDEPEESTIMMPQPLFAGNGRLYAERTSDELEDTVGELQTHVLRHQRSGYFTRYSGSRPSSRSSDAMSERSSYGSLIGSNIPAWARNYYQRGERVSLGEHSSASSTPSVSRMNTAQSGPSISPATDHFPMSMFRPRNRPYDREGSPQASESLIMSDEHLVADDGVFPQAQPRRPMSGPWTPRLSRRVSARLSAWKAPSLDESLMGMKLFSRVNRQIVLFCVGFLFPLAWIVAAFLPLPLHPEHAKMKGASTPSQLDLERAMAQEVIGVDECRFLKARWWRNLNRVMSVVGLAVIGAIVALAVVASI